MQGIMRMAPNDIEQSSFEFGKRGKTQVVHVLIYITVRTRF